MNLLLVVLFGFVVGAISSYEFYQKKAQESTDKILAEYLENLYSQETNETKKQIYLEIYRMYKNWGEIFPSFFILLLELKNIF